jgi:hypothetical protein
MAEYDNKAFSSMQEATASASDKLFTESEYNINATNKERQDYDSRAYEFLQSLYQEDKAKYSDIKDWDFDKYLSNLKDSYLEEKFIGSKEGDPDYYGKAGAMLRSVYSDDVGQLKLSARNVSSQMASASEVRDRSNISIEAPEAELY